MEMRKLFGSAVTPLLVLAATVVTQVEVAALCGVSMEIERGEVRIVDSTNFPAAANIAMAQVTESWPLAFSLTAALLARPQIGDPLPGARIHLERAQ